MAEQLIIYGIMAVVAVVWLGFATTVASMLEEARIDDRGDPFWRER